jgi:hypothetical protein
MDLPIFNGRITVRQLLRFLERLAPDTDIVTPAPGVITAIDSSGRAFVLDAINHTVGDLFTTVWNDREGLEHSCREGLPPGGGSVEHIQPWRRPRRRETADAIGSV